MISRWLLPSGMEQRFITNFLGLPFYLINICYVLYLFLSFSEKPNKKHAKIITLIVCQAIFALLGWVFADYSDRWIVLFMNQTIFIVPVIMMFLLLNEKQINFLKYILGFVFFIICGEIILYSLGILHYQDLSGQEYGEIMRISTTIGGATGTGVIVFALGAFIFQHYIHKRLFLYIFLGIWGTASFYTISRSTIMCFALFVAIYLWKEVKTLKFSKKIVLIIGILLLFLSLNNLHVFDPIIERQKMLNESESIVSGREELFILAINVFEASPILGVGIGNMFPVKELRHTSNFKPLHFTPAHNYWLLTLGEQGIIGFIFLLSVFILIVRNLDYTNYCSYAVLLIMLIQMNTEAIFVDDEFIAPLFLLISTSLKPYLYEIQKTG
jgi:O-antigen ligase